MKKVILVVTSCTINGEVLPLDYKEQLIGLIVNPPGGMNLREMRDMEKVYDKLVEAQCPGFMLLEDAEHKTLSEFLQDEKQKFKVFDKDIKLMLESVIASDQVQVNQVAPIDKPNPLERIDSM